MKVGILTHYYNSVNYGGNLQAYALCKAVENLGHEAQQVQVVYTDAYQNLLNPNAERKRKAIKLAKKPAQCLAWTVLPGYRAKCRRRKAAAICFISYVKSLSLSHLPMVRTSLRRCATSPMR